MLPARCAPHRPASRSSASHRQAMDRAHRLGQRRTVNVYRLIMRDTLEERIMGLQRFKLDVANAVVNQVGVVGRW
jgi:SNF2 family DNA or RNA helicase